jgi:hypothetical protein
VTTEFNFDWAEERAREVDEAIRTYDPAKEITLRMRWKGTYDIRLLPCGRDDWMVPIGEHRHVLPDLDDNMPQAVPCPRVIYGDSCAVCDAINWGMAKSLLNRKSPVFCGDKEGKGGIKLRAAALIRGLLLDYTKHPDEKNPPDFGPLPALKIIKIPAMIVKELNAKLADTKKFGAKKLMEWDTGHPISISGHTGNKLYWEHSVLLDAYPIPEEFRDPEIWPDIRDQLPKSPSNPDLPYSNQDLLEAIEKHQAVVPDVIHQFALSIDANKPKALTGSKTKSLQKRLNSV